MTSDLRPRVLIAVTSPLSWGPYRGFLRHIRSAGLDPIMLSPPGKLLDVVSREENVPTVAVPIEREISPIHDLVSLWKLYRVIREIRPEIVDASTPKAGLLAGMAAVLARVPCRLYTLRGLRLETTKGIKKAALWLAEWIACKCAHQVVCVGPSLRDRAVALKLFPPSKGKILGMGSGGVDVTRFHPSNRNSSQAQILRETLGLCGDETVVGFVGRFVRDKGIRELVEAFRTRSKTDPKLRLLLVGDFESGDPVEPEVQRYIESNPSIVRTGFVTDTAPYFGLMDMLALPTYREGFPVAPLEAQASGIPVITTTATGAVDSVIDGVTGILVPVGDSDALAGAIEKLLCDPELRSRMGQAGRARVERDFRCEVHWNALIGEYQTLLKDRIRTASTSEQHIASIRVTRVVDVILAVISAVVLAIPMLLIAIAIKMTSKGPVLHWSERVGRYNRNFLMPKFRTMRVNTPQVATHLLASPDTYLTPMGRSLRKSSLDELPQIWSVLVGDLSFVGPRPALYGQHDLVELRTRYGIHELVPGVTGWAQINGRDELSIADKVAFDREYVERKSAIFDLKILILTIFKVFQGAGVSH